MNRPSRQLIITPRHNTLPPGQEYPRRIYKSAHPSPPTYGDLLPVLDAAGNMITPDMRREFDNVLKILMSLRNQWFN